MKRVLAIAAFGMIAACTTLSSTPGEPRADAQFRTIYETEWAWRATYDPQWDEATPDDKLPVSWGRVDATSQAEQLTYMKDVIAKLAALDAKALSPEAQINLAIYRDQIEVRMARIEFREYENLSTPTPPSGAISPAQRPPASAMKRRRARGSRC